MTGMDPQILDAFVLFQGFEMIELIVDVQNCLQVQFFFSSLFWPVSVIVSLMHLLKFQDFCVWTIYAGICWSFSWSEFHYYCFQRHTRTQVKQEKTFYYMYMTAITKMCEQKLLDLELAVLMQLKGNCNISCL